MTNLNDLRKEIRFMNRKSPIYKVIKEELLLLGYWKNRQRGDSSKGLQAQLRSLAQG